MVKYISHSFKNLRRRGIRSWLTLLGVFIGIASVISLLTLGSGLKAAVNAQFGVSSTQIISVQAGGLNYGPPGSSVTKPLTRQDSEAIGRLSTVEYVIPRNMELLRVEFNDMVKYLYLVNVIQGLENEGYEALGLKAESGNLLYSGGTGKVVIGNNIASASSNGFEKDIEIGMRISIQDKKYSVIGILEKKGSFILDNVILIYDSDLSTLADYGDNVNIIGVKVKDKSLMSRAKSDIEKLLRERRDVKEGEEDFEVSTPEAALEQVNSILNSIQIFIIIIASISIVVGAIGIVNTMATSVVERRKEIGVMKSVGARNRHIFTLFFVESGFLGLVGGFLGVVFGLAIGFIGTYAINSFVGATTSPSINYILIFLTLLGSFVIGSVAGIVPAMHAARQNPVEALRR